MRPGTDGTPMPRTVPFTAPAWVQNLTRRLAETVEIEPLASARRGQPGA